MAIQTINIGTTPNDGTGDPARTAFTKLNANFTQAENAASHLLLGTVSQSGGVPTGAIIERGSNANGEFVRYADGTQICTTTGVFTAAAINTQLNISKPHPASFSAIHAVQYSAQSQVGAGAQGDVGLVYYNGIYAGGTTTTDLFAGCYTYREAIAEGVMFYFTTFGRWY